jgi:hypothetical protein
MQTHAILRVVCDDGPFEGVQYMDEDSGRILFTTRLPDPRYRLTSVWLDAADVKRR